MQAQQRGSGLTGNSWRKETSFELTLKIEDRSAHEHMRKMQIEVKMRAESCREFHNINLCYKPSTAKYKNASGSIRIGCTQQNCIIYDIGSC